MMQNNDSVNWLFSTKQVTFGLRQKDGDQRNPSKERNEDRKVEEGSGQDKETLRKCLGAKTKAEDLRNPVGLGLGILF